VIRGSVSVKMKTSRSIHALFIGSAVGAAAVLPLPAGPPALAEESGLPPFDLVVTGGIATIPAPLTGTPGDAKEGVKVVTGRRLGNCLSCHEISALREEEFHGDIGPSLDGVAGRWDAAALRMIVVNAKMVFGRETVMPAFYRVDGLNRVRPEFAGKPILTARQVEDVVAFLATLKQAGSK
jgi:sulfur-oxidizing protein SoxX